MSLGLPTLPTFADDWLLGAGDLNRIGQVQAYVNQILDRPNIPFFYMPEDEPRYMVHRHRYLHWVVSSASGANLQVNGSTVDTASGTSGYADLTSAGLGDGEGYEVKWTGAATTCEQLFEHPETSAAYTLPNSSPTIIDVTTAAQLNAISGNTKYLADNIGNAPITPFVARQWHPVPSLTLNYGLVHSNRYLYFYGRGDYSGTQGSDDFTINWKIDGTTFRAFNSDGNEDDGGALFLFNWYYDLQGTDHLDSSWTATGLGDAGVWTVADGSTLGLSPGDNYNLTVEIAEAHLNTSLRIELIAELAAKALV